MNRRQFSRAAAGLVTFAAGLGSAAAEDPRDAARSQSPAKAAKAAAEPVDAPFVDPAHAHHASAAEGEPRYAALATAYGDCAAAAQACISHCQSLLATGDKSLGDCLKAVLDTDAIATAVARLGRYDSAWAPVIAKQSISVLDACIEACRPHVAHHAACRACSDACKNAIAKARPA